MGKENFIYGKKDKGRHEGKAAELCRIAEADDILEQIICSMAVVSKARYLPDRLVKYHQQLLQFWLSDDRETKMDTKSRP